MNSNHNQALMDILPDLERAAASVAGRWGGLIDGEDLAQSMALELLAHGYVLKVRSFEPAARRDVLYKIASRLTAREATDYEYFSGNFTYSTGEVRTLLSRGALDSPGHEVLEGEYVDTNAGNPMAVSACEISVEGVDLRTSFARLSEKHQGLIKERYVQGVPSSDASTRKELSRAVDALTYEMNRSRRTAEQEYEAR